MTERLNNNNNTLRACEEPFIKGRDFSGGPVIKNLLTNAGDMGSIPALRGFHMSQSNQACVPPQLLSL